MANLFKCTFDTKPLAPALSKYRKDIEKLVNKELSDAAKKIASNAKANCTIPSIAGTIKTVKEGKTQKVSVGQGLQDPEIAAYHEFGTGDFARSTVSGLPEDWVQYAATFIKNGQGRLPASPYLYRAYWSVSTGIKEDLMSKINNI